MLIIYYLHLFKMKKREKEILLFFFFFFLQFFHTRFFQPHDIVNFRTKYPLQNQNIVLCSVSEFCADWVTALLIKEWILQPSRLKHWLWEKNNNEENVCSLSGIRLMYCILRETVSYPHTGNPHASGAKIMTLFCKEQKQDQLESKILYIYIQLLGDCI